MDEVFLFIGQNLLNGTKVICWCCLNTPWKFQGLKCSWEIYILNPTYFPSSKTKTHVNFSLFFLDHLWRFYFFLGGTPTYICHFFRLFVRSFIVHHFPETVHHLVIIFGTHICKMMISPGFFFLFFFFLILIFWAVRAVVGEKIAQNENWQLHLSCAISQGQYSIRSWFLVHLCNMMTSPKVFFIFLKFSFLGLLGSKTAKNSPKRKITIASITLDIWGTIHHMLVIHGTHV